MRVSISNLLLFGIILLIACNTASMEERSLSDEKLARIMADLNVAEAATIGLSGYPKDSLLKVYTAQVFEMHDASLEEYEKNLRLLSSDIYHLERIVQKSIQLLEEADTKKPE